MHGLDPKKLGDATIPIHAGPEGKHSLHNPVNVPIYATSTHAFPTVEEGAARFAGNSKGFVYGRIGNPTTRDVEVRLAHLERADDAILLASGMAAVSTLILSLVKSGEHMICDHTLYGGTHSLLTHHIPKLGIEVSFMDTSDIELVRSKIKDNTKLIYTESPTNPTLRVVPLKEIAKIGKEHGILTAVDATFMTPILMKPKQVGIDIVIHSATKYLNGHSDVIAGVILADQEVMDVIRNTVINYGGNLGPFEAYLLGRGLKTLKLRMEKCEINGRIVAEYLRDSPMVGEIRYLGFESDPGHAIAKDQQKGFGSMINFEMNGNFDMACTFVNALNLATRAVSLGGVETLISHPSSTTHAVVSREDRIKAGITDTLMRISVGIEDVEDIIADLDQAFAVVKIKFPDLVPNQ
jgi:methionine-gamma-lyase